MGMITRVRGRLRSLHTVSKLDPEIRDEKIAETVCLLSILFLLPYCSRGHVPLLVSLGGWCVATYSFLVLPVLISANYKYPVRWLRHFIIRIRGWLPYLTGMFLNLGTEILTEVHYMEQFFIRLQTIYSFICQVCFFMLCESALNVQESDDLKGDKNVIVALTTILFYSVCGYFAMRIKDICQRTRARVMHSTPSVRNYFKWVCKIILEWAKAVVVVLYLREQGIHYEPNLVYTVITFIYYLCTESIFLKIIPSLVEVLNLEIMENLEHLYVPLFLNIFTIIAALILEIYTIFIKYSHFKLISFYFIVYLRTKDAYYNYWELIVAEKETYSSFRVATEKDIQDWADICAVCLNDMSRARITPCNHLFHPYCLKQCLKNSFYCPLCKRHFMDLNDSHK